ncbi:YegP family protein [Arthrobacter rhizosphaerae]|uniref:YegP family protein n=1 Tax=Arthrobacter rhizosphaerae TaxID=2855490 RepID=UPI001FF6BD71|nr:YegP family protein [Arthrobacter rhizosphaerae]
MAGSFEVFMDAESHVRFRLVAPNGVVLAVSEQFADKRLAAAAIKDVRECAGTGLIQDLCPKPSLEPVQKQHSTPRRPVVRRPYNSLSTRAV